MLDDFVHDVMKIVNCGPGYVAEEVILGAAGATALEMSLKVRSKSNVLIKTYKLRIIELEKSPTFELKLRKNRKEGNWELITCIPKPSNQLETANRGRNDEKGEKSKDTVSTRNEISLVPCISLSDEESDEDDIQYIPTTSTVEPSVNLNETLEKLTCKIQVLEKEFQSLKNILLENSEQQDKQRLLLEEQQNRQLSMLKEQKEQQEKLLLLLRQQLQQQMGADPSEQQQQQQQGGTMFQIQQLGQHPPDQSSQETAVDLSTTRMIPTKLFLQDQDGSILPTFTESKV